MLCELHLKNAVIKKITYRRNLEKHRQSLKGIKKWKDIITLPEMVVTDFYSPRHWFCFHWRMWQ